MAAMEGQLKKRGTKMPVMHDRYCVATWETDQALNKYVLLRSFKSQKNYLQSPAKPLSACTLKGFGDWDGKGNFRRYQHAFLMETREGQVFLCAAPSDAEKTKWLEFMSNTNPNRAPEDTVADTKPAAAAAASNDASAGPGLKLNKRLSMRFMTQALQNQTSDTKTARESDEHDSDGYDSDVRSTTDDEFSLDEHLGLCDCKSPGSTQDGHDDNQDDNDNNNSNDYKHDCTTTLSKPPTSALDDSRESPRVQTRPSVSNEDALKALDALTTPVARAARASPVSGLFDAEEVATIADFTQSVAPTPQAPALARTPVAHEATTVQTTSSELVNETPAASLIRVSSPPFVLSTTPTEPRDAEPRAARPAPTAGAASAAVDHLETKTPTEPLVAPLPLQSKKSEAELAPPAKQQDAVAQVTERTAVAETVVSPAPIVAVPEASAKAAAPEPARTPVVTPASTPDVVAAAPSSTLPASVVAPRVVEAAVLSPKSPSVAVETTPSSTTTTTTTPSTVVASKTESSSVVADAVAAPVVKPKLEIETPKIELTVRPPVVAAAPTAPVAAATAPPAVAAAPARAPAAVVADAAIASTPTLPLAEEAEGSLSLPPLIAVRAVEPMPLEPTTPTARSASASQRLARTTPSELAVDTSDDVGSSRPTSRSRSSSCSSSGDSSSPRRTRGRANSSVMPQSFEAFATPTRLRRYSFSSALAPVRASHAFTIGSPIKQTFLEPHLGYVRSGLSTMVPSFPGLLTTLTRQHSVDEREEFADQDADVATTTETTKSSTDIDEV